MTVSSKVMIQQPQPVGAPAPVAVPLRKRYFKKGPELFEDAAAAASPPTEASRTDLAIAAASDSAVHNEVGGKGRELRVLNAEIPVLVKEIKTCCGEALKIGLGISGSDAGLPLSKTLQLAELAREAILAHWAACGGKAAVPPPPALSSLAEFAIGLSDTFTALAKLQVPTDNREGEHTVRDNFEAGLHLVAVHLASSAACIPKVAANSLSLDVEEHDRPFLAFLSHVVRALFSTKGGTASGASALRLFEALALVWRAAHHALAAAGYTETPLARRLLQLAARCLNVPPPVAGTQGQHPPSLLTLGSAAAQFLVAAAGQGEAPLQALATEELAGGSGPLVSTRGSSTATAGAAADAVDGGAAAGKSRGRRRRQQGPGPHTAALLRAVGAACLPTGLGDPALPKEAFANKAVACLQGAEARAAALVTGIIQRGLLASPERDSEGWIRLEVLTRELLDSCSDPSFPAAPLLLLCLARGFARVAGAARSVEMAWTQREFAVRLLGLIASNLCREYASASKYADSDSDLQALANWANGAAKVGARTRAKAEFQEDASEGAKEFPRLLTQFLEAAPATAELVSLPPKSSDVADSQSQSPLLESAVLSAEDPVYSTAFILCSWAAPRAAQDNKNGKGGGRKKSRSGLPPSRSGSQMGEFADDDADGVGEDSSAWALTAWATRAFVRERQSTNRKSGKTRDAIAQIALRLYKNNVHTDMGAVSRARMVALEVLLKQLRSSPLVFVRRQALSGLAGACCADRRLASTANTGEALSRGLRDDSALVRSASVDFIGRLVGGRAEDLETSCASQLRAAARGRLADPAPGVRRAAFRVVCEALCREDPELITSASELMRRIRFETQQVREPVLAALERVLLSPPLPASALGHLASMVCDPEIGGAGLRDLFGKHRSAHDQKPYAKTMVTLATNAMDAISSGETAQQIMSSASVLVQIGLEHPAALYDHVQALQAWLVISADASASDLDLGRQACRILSDILPSWAAQADDDKRQQVGNTLQDSLVPLLDANIPAVARGAMECLCIVAIHVTERPHLVLAHVSACVQYLRETIEQGSSLDESAQQLLCRRAWVLSTAHEFMDVDGVYSTIENGNEALALAHGTVGLVSKLLCALCLKGPISLRPLLVPCLGFLARRHLHLVQTKQLGLWDVFKLGLSSPTESIAVQASTSEALAQLLTSYQKKAESAAPPGGVKDEVVAKALLAPKVSEAVQRLAELQPAILQLLLGSDTRATRIGKDALSAVRSLSELGNLHPSPALAALVSSSIVGIQSLVPETSRLMMKIVESSPQQLLKRLSVGIRQAAKVLQTSRVEPGSFFQNSWRFSTLADICAEHFESKRLRESFLSALLAEVESIGNTSSTSPEVATLLQRTELLLGILVALPYRFEFELAQILRRASQFLTLRAIPLLPDTAVSAMPDESSVFGTCCASLLFHSVCQHFCSATEMQRLLIADENGETDKPLSGFSSRRMVPDDSLRLVFVQFAAAAGSTDDLLEILAQNVPLDSCLLKGLVGGMPDESCKKSNEGKGGRGRKRVGEEPEAEQGRQIKRGRPSKTEAVARAAAACGA